MGYTQRERERQERSAYIPIYAPLYLKLLHVYVNCIVNIRFCKNRPRVN